MDPFVSVPSVRIALEIVGVLDRVVGPTAAQFWMLTGNPFLDGRSPAQAIKAGEGEKVQRALRALKAEHGLFDGDELPVRKAPVKTTRKAASKDSRPEPPPDEVPPRERARKKTKANKEPRGSASRSPLRGMREDLGFTRSNIASSLTMWSSTRSKRCSHCSMI
jgi:hypothetical protein